MLLFVDDDLLFTRALVREIGAATIEVVTAGGGAAAKEILRTRPINVLATDFMMAGETGLALLDWVRLQHPLVGRVLFTGLVDAAVVDPLLRSGRLHGVLQKPFLTSDLLAVITDVIRTARPPVSATFHR
ncbi:MAG: response regulator [Deltaproteobacteria bacterium]|nr:response regulator [Deltaproteobacteria bacterium]